jgi:hypothetical protein
MNLARIGKFGFLKFLLLAATLCPASAFADSENKLALHKDDKSPSAALKEKQNSIACPQKRATLSAPPSFLGMGNPLPPSEKNILAGKTLFLVDAKPFSCQTCHGLKGDGFGIAFKPEAPTPRNFTCSQTMKDISDGQMFWIIQNGSPGSQMPAYKDLEEDQIWQVILYLRHFIN